MSYRHRLDARAKHPGRDRIGCKTQVNLFWPGYDIAVHKLWHQVFKAMQAYGACA
jgi:hypothetical protein